MQSNNNPIIAVVGRPNVGKSTLFNRLLGKRKAIESETAGTTRDRLYGEVTWRDKLFTFIDTAGLFSSTEDSLVASAIKAAEVAMDEADLIIMVIDGREGLTNADLEIAKKLRKSDKKVILAANKVEGQFSKLDLNQFKRAGFADIIPVSAISGQNSGDIIDFVYDYFKDFDYKEYETTKNQIGLAIIGRPNVGKSTLLNNIIGEEKMIVSDISGTTRDSSDFIFKHKNQAFKLIDTAGVRKRSKLKKETVESFAYLRSLRAMRDSDVVIYMIDAAEGLVSLDLSLLGEAKEMGKSIIIAINKIDTWPEEELNNLMGRQISILQSELNFMPWVPVVFISAKEKTNVTSLLNQATRVYKERFFEPEEKDVNILFMEAEQSQYQISYMVRMKFEKSNPPVFKIWTRKNKKPHFSHLRYLENRIRDVYPYIGTPIFIDWIKNPD